MRTLCFVAGLLCGLLLAIGIACKAQSLIISGVAIHLDGAHHCNWFTEGLGYEKPISDNWRIAVGAYANSNCRLSTYIASAWLPLHWSDWRFGTISGLVTGYRMRLTPAAGAVAAYEPDGPLGFNFILIPPSEDSSAGVLWLQAKWRW